MALVYAAITPHTPLIVPSVGRESVDILQHTRTALENAAKECYATQPDTIIILTPHFVRVPGAFTIGLAPQFHGALEQFGDYTLRMTLPGNIPLARRLKSRAEDYTITAVLDSEEKLDYGSTVPLVFFAEHMPKVKIIPIGDSTLDLETHFQFGSMLREEVFSHEERIAVLASADLTHREDKKDFEIHEREEPYDAAVLRAVREQNGKRLLSMPPTIPQDANECGFRSLVTFFGMLEGVNTHPRVFSYEAPVGVGFLVASLNPA